MKPSLADQLAEVERHIREGEQHLSHQRGIVDELERHGRGKSQTTKIAKQILVSFEATQSSHLNHRTRLLLALQKVE